MDEYVKRAAIMEFPIRKDHCDKERANEHFIFGIESVLEYVENLPAADVAPVVHGRWAPNCVDSPAFFVCDQCNTVWYNDTKYCPNCGARMDGDGDA